MNEFEWTYGVEYPEYKKGDIVTVPVSVTGRGYAVINSHEFGGGHNVYLYRDYVREKFRGFRTERWCRLDSIKSTDKTCLCEIGYSSHYHSSNCKYMNETHG
jgi:hypothetical protein